LTHKQNLQSIQRESQLTELSNNNNFESELQKKIDYITQYNSKAYFRNALERVANVIPENVTIICDYIIAEQTKMNIKESTKEGKMKVLTWLSNYFHNTSNKISFFLSRL
jgi:hypothetical protein